jgi:ribosomal protein L37E
VTSFVVYTDIFFRNTLQQERGTDMETLLSTDRCDRCGAQAYVRFSKGAAELDFCGHHSHRLFDNLEKDGWSISIDTRELLDRRAVGAEVA